jgi:hypothetical protein
MCSAQAQSMLRAFLRLKQELDNLIACGVRMDMNSDNPVCISVQLKVLLLVFRVKMEFTNRIRTHLDSE